VVSLADVAGVSLITSGKSGVSATEVPFDGYTVAAATQETVELSNSAHRSPVATFSCSDA